MKENILATLLIVTTIMTSACTGAKNSVVKVGDSYVSQSEFKYYLNSVKSQMEGTELSSEEDWQTKEVEGKKAIDLAKEKSLDTAVDNLAYIEVGKKVVTLTDDDKNKITSLKNNIITRYGGQSKYNERIKSWGVDDRFIDMLCESEIYHSKLEEKIESENDITDDMLKETFKQKYRRAKHILFLTQDMTTGLALSDDEKKAAYEKAQEVFVRAQSGEDFDALAKEFTQDPGLASNPDGYVFTDGEMVSEFEDGVDMLQNGQMSFVTSSYGYHIIKRLPLDETPELFESFFESKKDDVKNIIINDLLEQKMEEWKSEYNIVIEKNDNVYNEIN